MFEQDNFTILQDVFRKLGVPDDKTLTDYNLKKYVQQENLE